ncbi:hypothetical protein NIES2104_57920 [Leptolyngbya sp. NIES-2104]|nr:hypothetical protein NIES2104_57920 [Leptolyngbya sp. NIES-2104]
MIVLILYERLRDLRTLHPSCTKSSTGSAEFAHVCSLVAS